jgi:acetyl-CoA carboxylase alpha subunit
VIDGVVPEPSGGANKDYDRASRLLGDAIAHAFETIDDEPPALRRRRRRARFRQLGVWLETTVTDDEDVLAPEELV